MASPKRSLTGKAIYILFFYTLQLKLGAIELYAVDNILVLAQ
jgi:hypothetical protein